MMTRRVGLWLAAAALFAVAGCSGSDDSSGRSSASLAPAEACQSLLEELCGKYDTCTVGTAKHLSKSVCMAAVTEKVDCSKTLAVRDSYPVCMDELASMSCVSFASGHIEMPPSCHGVLLQNMPAATPPGVEPQDAVPGIGIVVE